MVTIEARVYNPRAGQQVDEASQFRHVSAIEIEVSRHRREFDYFGRHPSDPRALDVCILLVRVIAIRCSVSEAGFFVGPPPYGKQDAQARQD